MSSENDVTRSVDGTASSSVGVIETAESPAVKLLLLKLKTSVMIKQFCVWIHLRKVIFSRLRCDPA